jgi:hypothetical protein
MALSYILQQVGYKTGLNPASSNPGQRDVLLRFVNSAAREIYQTSDMAGSLEEQLFKVNANQTIALPDYVGQIRAMRESFGHTAIDLSQMRPQYNKLNWPQEWRNWRLKGLQTLQSALKNQSTLTITVEAVENPPIVINITGASTGSSNISETITITAVSMTTVNAFLDVNTFTKNSVNQYDIKLLDIDNNQLSYIANNKLQARFQIVDISEAPWFPPNMNPLWGWVEVLYKKSLPQLSNDTDEFPAFGYDDVIITKCLQLWYEEQANIQLAIAFQQKATMLLAQIHEDANRGTNDVVSLVEHPHDQINGQHQIGFGRDWRFAYLITGR